MDDADLRELGRLLWHVQREFQRDDPVHTIIGIVKKNVELLLEGDTSPKLRELFDRHLRALYRRLEERK
jgi:hypothetical protein